MVVKSRINITNFSSSSGNRPVSNLPYLSKLTESAVVTQLRDHNEYNGLIPTHASSYRKYHSTEAALLKVQSDIFESMDSQNVTLLVLLDLSAAFDTVSHCFTYKFRKPTLN